MNINRETQTSNKSYPMANCLRDKSKLTKLSCLINIVFYQNTNLGGINYFTVLEIY